MILFVYLNAYKKKTITQNYWPTIFEIFLGLIWLAESWFTRILAETQIKWTCVVFDLYTSNITYKYTPRDRINILVIEVFELSRLGISSVQ